MKKIWIALVALGMSAFNMMADVPEKLRPTEKECVVFLNEADDFIDDMAEGLQDRQADAVLHALRGQTSELTQVRTSRAAEETLSDKVERSDFMGEGASRGIRMRLYRPKEKKKDRLPLLIYLHGGGWTFGSIGSCSRFCDDLAAGGEVIVLAIDYSLAPENPFPSGLLDCVSAVEYAMGHVEEWGGDLSLVSLGGDSAGGNLAIATALYLQDQNHKQSLKSLVLFYPVVKAYTAKTDSWKKYSRGYGLDSRLMDAFNEAYLNSAAKVSAKSSDTGDSEARNPLISPAEADDSRLAKLPPVLIVGAERDILYDQGKEFAARLKHLGNGVDYIEFPGAVHLFITVKGQPSALAKAVDITSAFLQSGE